MVISKYWGIWQKALLKGRVYGKETPVHLDKLASASKNKLPLSMAGGGGKKTQRDKSLGEL